MTWNCFKFIFYNNFVLPNECNKAMYARFFMSQKSYFVQEYANKCREVLLKVLAHIPHFLQVHKFVLGLKETWWPLIHIEKCTMLNEAIELTIILEDCKRFTIVGSQRSS